MPIRLRSDQYPQIRPQSVWMKLHLMGRSCYSAFHPGRLCGSHLGAGSSLAGLTYLPCCPWELAGTWPSGLAEKLDEQCPEPGQLGYLSLIGMGQFLASGAGPLSDQAVQLAKDPMPCVLVLF